MVVVVVVLCVRLEGVDESAEADEDRVHDHHHEDGVAGHGEGEVVQVCVNVLVMELVIRCTGHAGFLGRVVRVLCVVVVAVETLVFAKASDATDEDAVGDHANGQEDARHQERTHPNRVLDVCMTSAAHWLTSVPEPSQRRFPTPFFFSPCS